MHQLRPFESHQLFFSSTSTTPVLIVQDILLQTFLWSSKLLLPTRKESSFDYNCFWITLHRSPRSLTFNVKLAVCHRKLQHCTRDKAPCNQFCSCKENALAFLHANLQENWPIELQEYFKWTEPHNILRHRIFVSCRQFPNVLQMAHWARLQFKATSITASSTCFTCSCLSLSSQAANARGTLSKPESYRYPVHHSVLNSLTENCSFYSFYFKDLADSAMILSVQHPWD